MKNSFILFLLLIGANAAALASSNAVETGFAMPSLSPTDGGDKQSNISCVYYNKRLLCDVHDHAWKDWGMGQQWGSIGTRFMLPQQGPAQAIRSSDAITGGNILNYGTRIEFGSITCKSERIGLTCTNTTGGMMHLNRDFYILNKPTSSIPK
ncbi:hypothetical protein [Synechococcus sp. UW140]|uniref:hypothetical protein n=1 Tax=Synechococcus sp. UW140 TaxID=368503 RepID=UPI001482B7DF|nr:hypothetical protein [Synechococcus sp. UW140]